VNLRELILIENSDTMPVAGFFRRAMERLRNARAEKKAAKQIQTVSFAQNAHKNEGRQMYSRVIRLQGKERLMENVVVYSRGNEIVGGNLSITNPISRGVQNVGSLDLSNNPNFTKRNGLLPGIWIWDVKTQPAFRKRGLAKQLLNEAIFIAQKAGVERMYLTPHTSSIGEIYRKMGFEYVIRAGERVKSIGERKPIMVFDVTKTAGWKSTKTTQ